MKEYIDVLEKCPIFSGISEGNLLAMLACLDVQIISAARNQTIFHEGDPARHMGIVLSGSVQILRHAVCGSRSIIATFGQSQIFGAAFACAAVDMLPVSVLAAADSKIMLIDGKRIVSVCSDTCAFHSKLISNLLQIVAERNILFNQKLEVITKRTTREKLMSFLSAQARQAGSNRFAIAYNRQQLADYLGVSRCAMTTELVKLRDEGYIHCSRNEFEILKMPEAHTL